MYVGKARASTSWRFRLFCGYGCLFRLFLERAMARFMYLEANRPKGSDCRIMWLHPKSSLKLLDGRADHLYEHAAPFVCYGAVSYLES